LGLGVIFKTLLIVASERERKCGGDGELGDIGKIEAVLC